MRERREEAKKDEGGEFSGHESSVSRGRKVGEGILDFCAV